MITIDTREKQSGVKRRLSKEVEVMVQTLKHGDYAFLTWNNASVGIQMKTAKDFISSLNSGHLEQELIGCQEDYQEVVLLTVGAPEWEDVRRVQSLKWVLQKKGIVVLEVPDMTYAAETILALYHKGQNPKDNFLSVKRQPIPKPRGLPPRVETLLRLGIRLSERQATTLVDRYGSLVKIALADEKELVKLLGIGEQTVKKIKEKLC